MRKTTEKIKGIVLKIVFLSFLFAGITSCNANDDSNKTDHKTFVLVHGSWQASFAWDDVKQQLEKQGHQVIALELQGHGTDNSPIAEATLANYVSRVKTVINAVNGKVILVGHSFGGAIITQTATEIPNKIEKLVYIAGFVPPSGKSVFELSSQDKGSSITPEVLLFSADGTTATFKNPDVTIPKIFCQDGTQKQNDLLVKNLKPEPLAAHGTPLQYDKTVFESLEKYYIYTTEDCAISYAFQQKMVQEAGITNTFSIQSGHSPFVSQPKEVYTILNDLTTINDLAMKNELKIGDKIPNFSLQDHNGKTFNSVTDLEGVTSVIYFYPKDESGVCTKEACAFRDSYQDFTAAGIQVIGINSAGIESHKQFAQKNNLPFRLLSDPGNKVIKQFGVKNALFLTGRETFVVNDKGIVVHKFRDFFKGEAHAQEVLQFLKPVK